MWPFSNRQSTSRSTHAAPRPARAKTSGWSMPSDFESMRRPAVEADRTLSIETELWLLRLPPQLRPKALADDYPRIANRLARDWSDAFLREFCFEDLLVDRRGGRRGFPPEVKAELLRLQRFSVRHAALIEEQTRRQSASADARARTAQHDGAEGLDWSPTETIVVTGSQLLR
jgi:hypothetical protein